MSQAEVKLDLSRIVFIGRTFEEYVKMFDLSAEQMAGKRILDCPSGHAPSRLSPAGMGWM